MLDNLDYLVPLAWRASVDPKDHPDIPELKEIPASLAYPESQA